MKRTCTILLLLSAMLLAISGLALANNLFDFEDLTVGPIGGQIDPPGSGMNWAADAGTPVVTNTPSQVISGTQSLYLESSDGSDTKTDRNFSDQTFTDNTSYITYQTRIDAAGGYSLVDIFDTSWNESEWVNISAGSASSQHGVVYYVGWVPTYLGTIRTGVVYNVSIYYDFPNFQRRIVVKSADGLDSFDTGYVQMEEAGGVISETAQTFAWDFALRGDHAAFDNIQVTTTPPRGILTGHITLQDFSGNLASVGVAIDLMQNSQVIKTLYTLLDASGNYSVQVDPGTYDVGIKAACWLRTIVGSQTITSYQTTTAPNVSLVNGDLDGDNQVTSTDLSIALKNLNQSGN